MNTSCFQSLVAFRDPANRHFFYEKDPNGEYDYLHSPDALFFVTDIQQNLLDFETLDKIKPEKKDIQIYLSEMLNDATKTVINDFQQYQSVNNLGKTLVDHVQAMKGAGHYKDKVSKSGRFVGWRINLHDNRDLSFTIRQIGLQLDTRQLSNVPIYIYRSGSSAPIKELNFFDNQANHLHWYRVPDINSGENYAWQYNEAVGEEYFIGYYEDDIQGYAIEKNWKFAPCGCIVDPYDTLSPYMHITAISVPASKLEVDRALFDPDAVETSYSSNFGLNLDFQIKCDLTGAFCDNKEQFAKAIQLKAGIKLLNAIYTTTNTNNLTMGAAKKDAYALAIDLHKEYDMELKRISVNFSDANSLCLPEGYGRGLVSMGYLGR